MKLSSKNEGSFVTELCQVVCNLISEKRTPAFLIKKKNGICSLIFVKVGKDSDTIKHKYMVNLYSVEKWTLLLVPGYGEPNEVFSKNLES